MIFHVPILIRYLSLLIWKITFQGYQHQHYAVVNLQSKREGVVCGGNRCRRNYLGSIHSCNLLGKNYCVNFSVHRVHNPLLDFSVHAKVDKIASVNVQIQCSAINYSIISSRNSSHIINRRCKWTIRKLIDTNEVLPVSWSIKKKVNLWKDHSKRNGNQNQPIKQEE